MTDAMAKAAGRWIAIAATVVVATALHAQNPPAPGAAQPAGTALLAGRVVDDAGAPIASAIVSIDRAMVSGTGPARGPASQARISTPVLTDSQGRFFFRDLAAGSYNLTATKPGWLSGAFGRARPEGGVQAVTLFDGTRRGDLSITMWKAATIAGRVVDDQGDPIVGAEARLVRQTYVAGRRHSEFAGRFVSDDRGAFRFPGLAPGDYCVVVPATVSSAPVSMNLDLGDPPREYMQTMSGVGAPSRAPDDIDVSTGNDRLAVSHPVGSSRGPSGDAAWLTFSATFFPSARTLSTASVIQVTAGATRTGLVLTVPVTKTYQVSGALVGIQGSLASHAVHLLLADQSDNPLFDVSTAVTDGTGVFTFYGVPPGQYIARIVRTPYPVEGQQLVFGGNGGDSPMSVRIGGQPSGPRRLSDEPLLYGDLAIAVVDRNVKDANIALRYGAHVRGRAVFLGTATPPTPAQLQNISVSLDPSNGDSYLAIAPNALSEDGHFATPSSWPGRYLVRTAGAPANWTLKSAMYQGHDVSETPLLLSSDIDDVTLTFTDHASKIDGTVQGDDGKSDLGAVVILFPTDAAAWMNYGRTSRRVRSTPTRNGAFTIADVPDGDYFLIAISDAQAADWQNPATLKKLSSLAEQVHVSDSQAASITLRTKRLP